MPYLIKSRIAPTPSGFLHIGNAFSFVLTWLIVRSGNGRLQLRIDDGDASRSRPEYIADIFDALAWLGVEWDAGPTSVEEFLKHYSQQNRQLEYAIYGNLLAQTGQMYACKCSRKYIQMRWANSLHMQICNDGLPLDEPGSALRMALRPKIVALPEVDTSKKMLVNAKQELGDIVLRKKDGQWAYQLCSLVEDMQAGTNFIVRGKDLIASSAVQLYLAKLLIKTNNNQAKLEAEQFMRATFLHHPIILDNEGLKLSKSAGSTSLSYLRKNGAKPDMVYRQVADYLQLPLGTGKSLRDLLSAAGQADSVQAILGQLSQNNQL